MKVNVLEIEDWQTPASRYEVAQVGNYRLGKHIFQPGLYAYHGMDGYTFFSLRKPIETTTLSEFRQGRYGVSRWHEWMVDSPTDYRAMQKYAEKARGKVLTTGLGLGLVATELCKNSQVENITVVEISPSVVELIKGYLPNDPRVNIVCSDFWKFIESDNSAWDTIIVDIWVYWGLQEQLDIFQREIVPADKKLRAKYPKADIVFHGFAGMPSLEQLDKVTEQGDSRNPLVIDPLIYGLA